MTSFDPAVDAALSGFVATVALAVEVVLPSYNLRLLDGGGTVVFPDTRVFLGQDATFGSIDKVDVLDDGTGDQAPSLKITLLPNSGSTAGSLAAANMQGSQVTLWLVVVVSAGGNVLIDDSGNAITDEFGSPILVPPYPGSLIGIPEPLFIGLLDVMTLKSGSNTRSLEFDVTSVFEDFFITNDGVRLTDGFHRSIWPNDHGLQFMTAITRNFYWGTNAPSPSSIIQYGQSGYNLVPTQKGPHL